MKPVEIEALIAKLSDEIDYCKEMLELVDQESESEYLTYIEGEAYCPSKLLFRLTEILRAMRKRIDSRSEEYYKIAATKLMAGAQDPVSVFVQNPFEQEVFGQRGIWQNRRGPTPQNDTRT